MVHQVGRIGGPEIGSRHLQEKSTPLLHTQDADELPAKFIAKPPAIPKRSWLGNIFGNISIEAEAALRNAHEQAKIINNPNTSHNDKAAVLETYKTAIQKASGLPSQVTLLSAINLVKYYGTPHRT